MTKTDKALFRYARQVQVLGEAKQRALMEGDASVTAPSGEDALGPLVEALYLAGAGVGTIRVPTTSIADAARAFNPTVQVVVLATSAEAEPSLHSAGAPPLRDATARSAAAAAARALGVMARLTGAAIGNESER